MRFATRFCVSYCFFCAASSFCVSCCFFCAAPLLFASVAASFAPLHSVLRQLLLLLRRFFFLRQLLLLLRRFTSFCVSCYFFCVAPFGFASVTASFASLHFFLRQLLLLLRRFFFLRQLLLLLRRSTSFCVSCYFFCVAPLLFASVAASFASLHFFLRQLLLLLRRSTSFCVSCYFFYVASLGFTSVIVIFQ